MKVGDLFDKEKLVVLPFTITVNRTRDGMVSG